MRHRDHISRSSLRARAATLVLALALGTTALCAPAQAQTGGASTVASTEAQAGAGIAFSAMRWAGATWYGPGLYGAHTACGETLRPSTIGVAHRSLPCGTPVRFVYRGRVIVAPVIDRGPYTKGNSWDLTSGAAQALGFSSTGQGQIGYAIALQRARP
jgi:rare lipoprotein A (peptidoglycan hydrolase)